MTEYEKRALDPCWQHKQTCVALFTLDSHNTSYLYRREDNTYYWQHCRKEAEDDLFIDADNIPKTYARMALLIATQRTIKSGLDILGVSSPDEMK